MKIHITDIKKIFKSVLKPLIDKNMTNIKTSIGGEGGVHKTFVEKTFAGKVYMQTYISTLYIHNG